MQLVGSWQKNNFIRLFLLITIVFLDTGSANAKKIEGCYAYKDSTGSYFITLQSQGDYNHYIRTSLDETVTATGEWWQQEQRVFTKIITSTIRDGEAVSRLVEGSISEFKIQPNGNLAGESKIYHPVRCPSVAEDIEKQQHKFLENKRGWWF